ncbi:MAG: DNA translocase FtsK 4TM domain-containing protein, partial [Planctomycetota bacterium]
MARSAKGVPARGGELPPASAARRAGWVLLTGLWLFLVLALGSYDSADAPSYVVAVHNQPAANLCGAAGAVVAHYAYHVVGVGSWVILAGIAGFLGVTVTGRRVSHPLVRFLGLLIIAVGVSSLHRLLWPTAGPLAGAAGGLLAELAVGEMAPRFSTVGTSLLILAAVGVGAVVAVDQLVLAVPRATIRAVAAIRAALEPLRSLRPAAAAAVEAARPRRRRAAGGAIDPDAGGIGAVEA